MCDYFWQRMEKDQGDLADIVRASRRAEGPGIDLPIADWQLPIEPVSFSPPTDAFGSLGDSSLLQELSGLPLVDGGEDPPKGPSRTGANGGGVGCTLLAEKMVSEETRKPNIFSRVLQMSPGAANPPPIPLRMIKPSQIANAPVDNTGVQISSTRPPGIKRRKSQAKKVVCIPAPQAACSRPCGEVVPSDLWAWRKYGQKPIKGSPYPRGYYRCSSSKGCSARKQVERSRTDPNMLVITYTSEHNHPWPTQRNALAGSTRSQLSKNCASAHKNPSTNQKPSICSKEEPKFISHTNSLSIPLVKEEVGDMDKAMDASDDHQLDQMFDPSYEPLIQESNLPDDFFADFAELEPNPMNLIFSKELMGDKPGEARENKAMDPFNIFDWGANS